MRDAFLCVMAEWYFRSSLDRYVWIHGMVCAYLHPWAEARLARIDALGRLQRLLARGALAAGKLLLMDASWQCRQTSADAGRCRGQPRACHSLTNMLF